MTSSDVSLNIVEIRKPEVDAAARRPGRRHRSARAPITRRAMEARGAINDASRRGASGPTTAAVGGAGTFRSDGIMVAFRCLPREHRCATTNTRLYLQRQGVADLQEVNPRPTIDSRSPQSRRAFASARTAKRFRTEPCVLPSKRTKFHQRPSRAGRIRATPKGGTALTSGHYGL